MKDYKKSIIQGILLLAMFAAVLLTGRQDFQREYMENEEIISDNTVLYASGFPGTDLWMDFTDDEITEDEYVFDIPQTVQQDTQYNRMVQNGYFADTQQCLWGNGLLLDDMSAILAKGYNLFLARRISDPAEDHIYRTLP